jgi:glycosyltransferase involved in cell wall biosynthesis
MNADRLVRVLVVIPAYNEAARLPRLLADVASYLSSDTPRGAKLDARFLVVDDGSRAEEYEVVSGAIEQLRIPSLALMRLERNQGKGAAIRAGFERGLDEGDDLLAFMDADSSVPVRETHRVIADLAGAAPGTLSAVIGSRVKMLGREVHRNPVRHYTGRVFATFVSMYFHQPVYDTQCGVKAFTRDAVRRHLPVVSDTRWVWDTELLLAILDAGEPVRELPIDWKETGHSKVSFISDPLKMVWRLRRFRRDLRARQGARPRGARA